MKSTSTLRKFGIAVMAACPALVFAAPPATSAYFTDAQHSFVQDQTSEGINQVNMIACFMGAMKGDSMVNKGDYLALVDEKKCDASGRDSASNYGSSNSGSNASQFITATVNSSRASSDDPMIVKTWVDENQEGNQMTIFVHTSATQAPSATNPQGIFRMDFCGKAAGGNSCAFNGRSEEHTSELQS